MAGATVRRGKEEQMFRAGEEAKAVSMLDQSRWISLDSADLDTEWEDEYTIHRSQAFSSSS